MAARLVAGMLMVAVATPARADDVAGASRAFTMAQEAALAGDDERAADLFELADSLAASAPALRNAMRARFNAGHMAAAATLATELLRRYPTDAETREVAATILAELAPTLTPVVVRCGGECVVLADDATVALWARSEHSFFITPGRHTITATYASGDEASEQIHAIAGRPLSIGLRPSSREEPHRREMRSDRSSFTRSPDRDAPDRDVPTPPAAGGLSRRWVLVGAAATVGLGAGATYFGLQTIDSRNRVAELVAAGDLEEANRVFARGRTQQSRTNILIGATAAAGVTTIVLAVLTRRSDDDDADRTITVAPLAGGATVGYAGRF